MAREDNGPPLRLVKLWCFWYSLRGLQDSEGLSSACWAFSIPEYNL
jgi:hypothetical protein